MKRAEILSLEKLLRVPLVPDLCESVIRSNREKRPGMPKWKLEFVSDGLELDLCF